MRDLKATDLLGLYDLEEKLWHLIQETEVQSIVSENLITLWRTGQAAFRVSLDLET